jgi:hypothetical protein
MRLLEELIVRAYKLQLLIISLVILDLVTFLIYSILDIIYSKTNSPNYSNQLTIFIIKSVCETILIVVTVIAVINKKIMPLIFDTIM